MSKRECVIDGCAKRIDDEWCICGQHWRLLPDDLRRELSRAYVPGMALEDATPGFLRALAAVHGWIRETFGADDRGPDPGRWDRLVRYVRERDAARAERRALSRASDADRPR